MPNITPDLEAARLFERAVIISVGFGRPGNRKKVKNTAISTEADKSFVHVSKDLLNSVEVKAIEKHDGAISRYLRSICAPGAPWLRGGHYLIANELVPVVDARLSGDMTRRTDVLVPAAIAAYPRRKQEAERALGPLFDPTDYPLSSVYAGAFTMAVRYTSLGVPQSLAEVSPEIYAREEQRQAREISEGMGEMRQALRRDFLEIVEHTVERLTPQDNGTPKAFKRSLVGNMATFIATFPARNGVVGDSELAPMVERAGRVFEGMTWERLRDNPSIRTYTLAQMQEIATVLAPITVRIDERLVELDEAA